MNKKGFTLIEIIISIGIIAIIGIPTFLFFKEKPSNDNIEDKILEAANVYVSIEKDINGRNFLDEIFNGGRGVIIPLTKLVEKGYLSNNIVNTIEKKYPLKEHHVLALLGDGTLSNDCNGITLKLSWDESYQDEVYLCPISNGSNEEDFSDGVDKLVYFIIDSACEDYKETIIWAREVGSEDNFPSGVCKNAKNYTWKKILDNTNELDQQIFNSNDKFVVTKSNNVFILEPTLYTLNDKIDALGIEKNHYFPVNSTNNYVLFANNLWLMFYYGDNSVKLVLKDHIGYSKFNETEEDGKSVAFEYYDTDVDRADYTFSDIGKTAKVPTQEKTGEKISSTIKKKLDDWYNKNLKEKYYYDIIKTNYCNDTSGYVPLYFRKNGKLDADTCSNNVGLGGKISTKIGLLTLNDVMNLGIKNDLWITKGLEGKTSDSFLEVDYNYWLMTASNGFNQGTYMSNTGDYYLYDMGAQGHALEKTLYNEMLYVKNNYYFYYDHYRADFSDPAIEHDPHNFLLSAPSKTEDRIAIRPVITIKSNSFVISGEGTENNPYVIFNY